MKYAIVYAGKDAASNVVSGDIEVHASSEAEALEHARKARGLIEIKAKVLKKLK